MNDDSRFFSEKPLIGMLHLKALPGSPLGRQSMKEILAHVLADARALVDGGCHALMMENFGDVPFAPGRVAAETIAAMTFVAAEVRRLAAVPLGINVLRNDGLSALAIAAAVGADFIRVNVLSGARVTDQGLVQGIAYELMRLRTALGRDRAGEMVKVFADVDVKHSAALAARPLKDEVEDTLKRGLADAVIVSGRGTGASVDLEHLKSVKAAAGVAPVLIGSGVTVASLARLWPHADGFIVGTSLKADGLASAAVDRERVGALVAEHRKLAR